MQAGNRCTIAGWPEVLRLSGNPCLGSCVLRWSERPLGSPSLSAPEIQTGSRSSFGSMTQPAVPPGWHRDPYDPNGAVRWWDGSQWTQHTSAVEQAPARLPPFYGGGATGVAPSSDYSAPTMYPTPNGGAPVASPWVSQPPSGWQPPPQPSHPEASDTSRAGFVSRNRDSVIALALVAVYIFIASTSHVALLGIAPLLASIRALTRREPLAILALLAAIAAIVVGFKTPSGHHI